jgi:hypothetical protein
MLAVLHYFHHRVIFQLNVRTVNYFIISEDPIRPGFLGIVPILWVFISSVPVLRKIQYGTPNIPTFPSYKNIFLELRMKICTFLWYIYSHQPATSRQK